MECAISSVAIMRKHTTGRSANLKKEFYIHNYKDTCVIIFRAFNDILTSISSKEKCVENYDALRSL